MVPFRMTDPRCPARATRARGAVEPPAQSKTMCPWWIWWIRGLKKKVNSWLLVEGGYVHGENWWMVDTCRRELVNWQTEAIHLGPCTKMPKQSRLTWAPAQTCNRAAESRHRTMRGQCGLAWSMLGRSIEGKVGDRSIHDRRPPHLRSHAWPACAGAR